jgi:predicted SnoaL-like aldol condensation-catalyzing enzyme
MNSINKFICPTTTNVFLDQHDLQAAMDRFAHIFYIEKDVKGAFDQYVAANYIQHNPNILDGRNEAIEALKPLFGQKGNIFEVIGSSLKLMGAMY